MDDTFGVSLDNSGNMYFSGRTWSDDYPTKNAFQKKATNDTPEGTIASIDENGQLIFSSYAGGSGWDTLHFVEVDSLDNVLTTGIGGPDGFPICNEIQTSNQGSVDLVIMILSPTGQPFFCSYFGGLAEDSPRSLFVSENKALIVGGTRSSNFPVSNSSYQQEIGGEEDGFFLRFDYINYLEEYEIDTRPSNVSGFTFITFGIGFLVLFMSRNKNK